MSRIYFHDRHNDDAEVRGSERALFGNVIDGLGRALILPWKWQEYSMSREQDWHVALNTAMAIGNAPMRLATRLHAQCEVHCFVEGPNRSWLAEIIEEGRRSGLYRDDSGWESVSSLLRIRGDSPVVTSYSVCDQFPTYRGEEDEALTYDQLWDREIAVVRSDWSLELRPDNFATFRFGERLTIFDQRAKPETVTEPSPPEGSAQNDL